LIFVADLLILLFTGLKVEGRENIPEQGGFLLVGNHLSVGDPVFLGAKTGRPVMFMAKGELYKNRLLSCIVRSFGSFPVERGKFNRAAVIKSHEILQQGKILGMFPEGRRSKVNMMQKAQYGAAMIAAHNHCLIIPVGIYGSERIRGFKWIFSRPKIVMRFGKGFKLENNDTGHRIDLEKYTDTIMMHIAELIPAEYRGYYKSEK